MAYIYNLEQQHRWKTLCERRVSLTIALSTFARKTRLHALNGTAILVFLPRKP